VKEVASKYNMNYFISTEGAAEFAEVYEKEDVVKKYAPKMCKKCGSTDIGVAIMGEPVYICKKCKRIFGTVPFDDKDTSAINKLKKYESEEYVEETKRSELPDSVFGTDDRRYPLDTKKHVYSAIRLFGHCDESHRAELAKKIFAAMKKYKIPMSAIGPKNKLRDYIYVVPKIKED
jgi:ribosomal protein L37AE/L43A